VGERGGKE